MANEVTPRIAAGRSVKSIVQWLEAAGQPSSPSAKSAASGDASSRKQRAKSSIGTEASTPLRETHSSRFGRERNGSDDEELSLAFLKYQRFFDDKPLARRLDSIPDDICQISKAEMIRRAEQINVSERAKITVDWSNYNTTESSAPSAAQPMDSSTQKSSEELNDAIITSYADESDERHVALAEQPKVTPVATKEDASSKPEHEEQLIRRDPAEVNRFWNHVRSYLWISDSDLESGSDADSDSSHTPGAVSPPDKAKAPSRSTRLVSGKQALMTENTVYVEVNQSPRAVTLPESIDDLDDFFEQPEADTETKQTTNADGLEPDLHAMSISDFAKSEQFTAQQKESLSNSPLSTQRELVSSSRRGLRQQAHGKVQGQTASIPLRHQH